ncbi:MAG: response regulator [Vulcanimicrobiota bacterium]
MTDLQARLLEAFKIECPEHLQGIRRALTSLEEEGASEETFYEILRHTHTLKGAARAAGLSPVERAAHELESVFSREPNQQGLPSEDLLPVVCHLLDLIQAWVSAEPSARPILPELAALRAGLPNPEEGGEERAASHTGDSSTSVRLSEAALDSILLGAGEVLAQHSLWQGDSHRLTGLLKGLRELKSSFKSQGKELARLEILENLCREMIQEHHSRSTDFHRTASQLFQAVSEARLIQAEGVLAGMGPMVREVARAQGRQVRYVETGLDTRVDRAVLQQLKVPIMHCLRNAVYHGIEPPELRVKAGKPKTGVVKLSLELQEASLVVTISDDGRGLQEEEVFRKASEHGLTGTMEELLRAPQMTTATEVSDIAGRGLGLSVAGQTLDALQGSLRVDSQAGLGTRFVFQVPVTIFSRLLVFVSSLGQLFALQGHAVHALLEVDHERVESVEGRQMLEVDGEMIPIAELSDVIAQGYPVTRIDDRISVVILKQAGRKAALVVDGFENCKKMMIRPCSVPGMPPDTFAGTVTRHDGTICLVLSAPHLLRKTVTQNTPRIARSQVAEVAEHRPDWPASILVVDDSITTRTLEKSILETHGYHVLVAMDGIEALRLLGQNRVDLVISDVEMPNLDGFGLLERMKNDQGLSEIPVVLLTSRQNREDQKKGLDLGAEAYLVKQEFDQLNLLETVRQLV